MNISAKSHSEGHRMRERGWFSSNIPLESCNELILFSVEYPNCLKSFGITTEKKLFHHQYFFVEFDRNNSWIVVLLHCARLSLHNMNIYINGDNNKNCVFCVPNQLSKYYSLPNLWTEHTNTNTLTLASNLVCSVLAMNSLTDGIGFASFYTKNKTEEIYMNKTFRKRN